MNTIVRHQLSDDSNGHADSKLGHTMISANWIPVNAPSTVISRRSLASVKSHHPDKTPVHEKPEKAVIAINLAGKNGLQAQINWPTQEDAKLVEFIRELLA